MNIIQIFMIALAVSMDAFAVSIAKGICHNKNNQKLALQLALSFGFFQALMPVLGYYFTSIFSKVINQYSAYLSFVLLTVIALKMIFEKQEEDPDCEIRVSKREILLLSVATSIDAFAIGATFSMVGVSNIYFAVLIIGITTFMFSFLGVKTGFRLGCRFEKYSEIFGGLILLIIAVNILI